VIPSEKSLSDLQPKLESRYKVFKLQQSIDQLIEEKKFDEVVFDTPPSLNFYSMSALMASDRVLVPFDCDAFSAEALHHVQDIVDEIAADHNDELKTEGIVVNHFMANAKLPQSAINDLLSQGFRILKPYLSSSIVMRESHAANTPLIYLKPNHKLTKEFMKLATNLSQPVEEKLQFQLGHKSEKVTEV
jgi:chromosome partitioning protein